LRAPGGLHALTGGQARTYRIKREISHDQMVDAWGNGVPWATPESTTTHSAQDLARVYRAPESQASGTPPSAGHRERPL